MALPITTRSGLVREVPLRVTVHHLDLASGEERGHGRINILVRAGDGKAFFLHGRGGGRHGRAADADKVNRPG
jgi:hypothetical protein